MRTTIDSQRNIIEVLRAENERLRDILKRNGINIDTKLPDWMGQKQNAGWRSGKVDIIAIWGNGVVA
jgi:methanogenic corrinoid protein MtbC1